MRSLHLSGLVMAALALCGSAAAGTKTAELRLGAPTGRTINPLNGVNNAPRVTPSDDGPFGGQCSGNEVLYAAAKIPFARAHEAALSYCYGGHHCVDISGIFPDFSADPDDPKSYDFAVTDKYIADVRSVGAEVLYRMGETIEHMVKKYGAWPPKDFEKWAKVCEHLIAHYNEGWADGFRWNIRYWEIWNEPDLDSWGDWKEHPHCWGGTPEQFYDLYEITAKRLKGRFPNLKIGGPGSCCREDWAAKFLKEMKKRDVPIDFFSWHLYCNDADEYLAKAKRVRAFMDAAGYAQAESILDEWNYIRNWTDEFAQTFRESGTSRVAAFMSAALSNAQRAGVDKMMYYDAGPTTMFNTIFASGSFDALPGYYALYAWGRLRAYARETSVTGADGDLTAVAGMDAKGSRAVLFTRYVKDANVVAKRRVRVVLPDGTGPESEIRLHLVDPSRRFTEIPPVVRDGAVELDLEANAFALLEFRRAAP